MATPLLVDSPSELEKAQEIDLETQREDSVLQEDDGDEELEDVICIYDAAMAKEILRENTVIISENVNLESSLMAYLIQNRCIDPEQMTELRAGKSLDNNMKLIGIMNRRGVTAFNGFMKSLKEFTTAHTAEGAHIEVLRTLTAGAKRCRYRRRPTGSSQTSFQADPHTSITSIQKKPIPKEKQTDAAGQDVEKDLTQVPPQNKVDPNGSDGETAPPEHVEVPTFRRFVWSAAVITCICSPVSFIGGIIILSLSGIAFGEAEECQGVGAKHSLSVFNFFFSLLCLSVPGLLIMLTIYFCCEYKFEDRWEKKFLRNFTAKRFIVWLTIGFCLAFFVLTVMELLYSLAYVASEVYTNYAKWRKNETLCKKEVYLTSFTILTVSGSVIFILLTVLGVFVAMLFFRWVTDPKHPGILKSLILAYLPKNRANSSTTP